MRPENNLSVRQAGGGDVCSISFEVPADMLRVTSVDSWLAGKTSWSMSEDCITPPDKEVSVHDLLVDTDDLSSSSDKVEDISGFSNTSVLWRLESGKAFNKSMT